MRREVGLVWKKRGTRESCWCDKPQAVEHHRFDGIPHREVAHCRVLMGGVGDDVSKTEFVKHGRDKARDDRGPACGTVAAVAGCQGGMSRA